MEGYYSIIQEVIYMFWILGIYFYAVHMSPGIWFVSSIIHSVYHVVLIKFLFLQELALVITVW